MGRDPGEQHFHWRHPKELLCLTLAYDGKTRKLLGINTFGIRLRHEVIDRWLTQGVAVDQAVERLGEANFDPEQYHRYEGDILQAFTSKTESIL